MATLSPLLPARLVGQYSKVFFCIARRYGSSPEMPIVGTEGWQSMLNNLRAHQIQPPLSHADVLNSQRLKILESEMTSIKKMMASVVDSNRNMQRSLENWQQKNIASKLSGSN